MVQPGDDASNDRTILLDRCSIKCAWQAMLTYEGHARPKREVTNE